MTKVCPRNTLCSTPDWASKARAQASPLPVNTVDTQQYTGPFLAATLPLPQAQDRLRKWCGLLRVSWKTSGSLGKRPSSSQSCGVGEVTEGPRTDCHAFLDCKSACAVLRGPAPKSHSGPGTHLIPYWHRQLSASWFRAVATSCRLSTLPIHHLYLRYRPQPIRPPQKRMWPWSRASRAHLNPTTHLPPSLEFSCHNLAEWCSGIKDTSVPGIFGEDRWLSVTAWFLVQ